MRKLASQAVEVYQRYGLGHLLRAIPSWCYREYIRPVLPYYGYVTRNGVRVGRRKLFDGLLPSRQWHQTSQDQPNYESGILRLQRDYLSEGDEVVIIGGGYGVSMVHAANLVGPTGSVTVYEGSVEQADLLGKVARLNDVDSLCTVEGAVVGRDVKVYGEKSFGDSVSPADLPDCDVLELDCEGAEYQLLSNLECRPISLIIEVHPHLVNENPRRLLDDLAAMGYSVVDHCDHDGNPLSTSEFQRLLDHDRDDGRYTDSGFVHPPIIVAVLE